MVASPEAARAVRQDECSNVVARPARPAAALDAAVVRQAVPCGRRRPCRIGCPLINCRRRIAATAEVINDDFDVDDPPPRLVSDAAPSVGQASGRGGTFLLLAAHQRLVHEAAMLLLSGDGRRRVCASVQGWRALTEDGLWWSVAGGGPPAVLG